MYIYNNPRSYNGERKISSTSGFGKTRQQLAKKCFNRNYFKINSI